MLIFSRRGFHLNMKRRSRYRYDATRLNRDLEIPSVSACGIDREEFSEQVEKMAADAGRAGSTANNPVRASVEQIIDIYHAI